MAIDWYVVLGLAAGFFWGVSVYLDKNWVMEDTESDFLILTASIAIAPILATPILFFPEVRTPSLWVLLICILYGSAYTIATYFYLLALRVEDASVVSPMMRLSPVFTIILAVIFLNQILDLDSYLGIAAVFTGVLVVSINRDTFQATVTDAAIALAFSVVSTFVYAVGNILLEIALDSSGTWEVFYWSRWGALLPLVLLLPSAEFRRPLIEFARNPRENGVVSLTVTKTIETGGALLYVAATAFGPVSVVVVLSALESIFVMLIAILVATAGAKQFDIGRRLLLKRFVAAILVVLGVALISL